MRLCGLPPLIATSPSAAELARRLAAPRVRCLAGVPDAAKPALLAALLDQATQPALIVTPRPDRAAAMHEELGLYLADPARLLLFPELDAIPYERVSPDVEAADERLRVLQRLAVQNAAAPLVVTSAMALAQRTLAPAERQAATLTVRTGMRIARAELLARLLTLGYETVPLVEARGQVGHRGGIVDVFPPSAELPLRIELFGDEIDSLRTFDPLTQRTVKRVDAFELGPAREASAEQRAVAALLDALDPSNLEVDAAERFEDETRRLREGDLAVAQGFYLPFLARASLLDYFDPASLLIVDEPADIAQALDDLDAQAREARDELQRRHLIPLGLPLPHAPRADVESELGRAARRLDLHRWATEEAGALRLPFSAPETFAGRLRPAMHGVLDLVHAGDRVAVTSQQSARLEELFRGEGSGVTVQSDLLDAPEPGGFRLIHGSVGAGWTLPLNGHRLHLLTDTEIFGFTKQRRPQRVRASNRDAFLAELSPGDHVVHIEHGIGVFHGLVRRLVDGVEREYLELRYAEGDRLLVPTDQVDRVSRYVGPSDRTPAPTRLGTSDWARAKERVRRAVTDLAQELLTLYAAREL